jgi:hypothetical protein
MSFLQTSRPIASECHFKTCGCGVHKTSAGVVLNSENDGGGSVSSIRVGTNARNGEHMIFGLHGYGFEPIPHFVTHYWNVSHGFSKVIIDSLRDSQCSYFLLDVL